MEESLTTPSCSKDEIIEKQVIEQSSESEVEPSSEEEDTKQIDVDFEFYDVNKNDFHSVKNFLNVLLAWKPNNQFNTSDIADMLVSEGYPFGITVKVDGEHSDPFSITTCIRIGRKSKASFEVVKSCHSLISDEKMKKKFKEIIEGKELAWLINERIINVPGAVSVPLFKFIADEVEGEEKPIDYLLLMSSTYREVASDLDAELGIENPPVDPTLYYYKEEEEVFEKYAEFYWRFDVPESESTHDSKRAFTENSISVGRTFFVIATSQLRKAIQSIEALYNKSNN